MNNCIEEGTLQAWLDGELAADKAASVATHLTVCPECAAAARTVEAESLFLAEALAPEFAATVPSERLRQRVDAAVATLHDRQAPRVSTSRWNAFTELFSFRSLAYASAAAAIVLAAIVGVVYFKHQQPTPIANANKSPVNAPQPQQSPTEIAHRDDLVIPAPSTSPVKIAYKSKAVRRPRTAEPDARSIEWQERQYENAIAKLGDALKTQPPMRPALQVEYEYNMAVIDSAIATSRDAAKKKPKDPLANQFMLAAYQSKVDFMNQIADARGLEK
jgi:negative regulator of sigma E activity